MTEITDEAMRSEATSHTATRTPDGWAMTWLPGRILDRDAAVTAMTIAETVAMGRAHPGDRLWAHVQNWAAELDLGAPDAVRRVAAPVTDPAPTPNVPLLKQTLAHIEAHPTAWNQDAWCEETDCGTAYCFAGHAIVLHGAHFAVDQDGDALGEWVAPPGRDPADKDLWVPTAAYAAKLLGLRMPYGVLPPLFQASNTLDDLRRMVDEICQEAGS